MRSVETDSLSFRFDRLADDLRDPLQLVPGRLVGHTDPRHDPALVHATEIANPTGQQIGVGEHELLS